MLVYLDLCELSRIYFNLHEIWYIYIDLCQLSLVCIWIFICQTRRASLVKPLSVSNYQSYSWTKSVTPQTPHYTTAVGSANFAAIIALAAGAEDMIVSVESVELMTSLNITSQFIPSRNLNREYVVYVKTQ